MSRVIFDPTVLVKKFKSRTRDGSYIRDSCEQSSCKQGDSNRRTTAEAIITLSRVHDDTAILGNCRANDCAIVTITWVNAQYRSISLSRHTITGVYIEILSINITTYVYVIVTICNPVSTSAITVVTVLAWTRHIRSGNVIKTMINNWVHSINRVNHRM